MNGQAVVRILLVITLIVTAHAIKPFSFKNITTHLLTSTKSLAFVLPDSARDSVTHATYLAMALSDSLFEDEQQTRWAERSTINLQADVTVQNQLVAVTRQEKAKPRINPAKVTNRSRTIVSHAIRAKQNEGDNLISSAEEVSETTEEVASAESESLEAPATKVLNSSMPVVLPAIELTMGGALSKVRPHRVQLLRFEGWRIELLYLPKKPNCDQKDGNRDSKQGKLVALIEEPKKLVTDLSSVDTSISSILDCVDEGTKAITEEETAGHQEQAVETQAVETQVSTPNPLHSDNCSMQLFDP